MQCPSGHRVAEGSKFCPTCGLSLSAERCRNCDALLTPGDRFCRDCGAEAAGTAPAGTDERPEDELRQITAVFCDMVASTELSARLDPEEFGDLTRAYQERVGEVLERYGGAVMQYLGDGILINFGWPLAHDDDAERAVLAALVIVEELGKPDTERPLTVRIGIHTGPVIVGEMGSADRRETMALGETMNRAARLQGCAAPASVVISETTLRLVKGIFLVEDLGPQELKGIEQPVGAYRVLQRSGVRSKLDAAGEPLTRFVSRDEELSLMLERWRLARGGEGQALLLTGEPGIGKSRLVYELRKRLPDSDHTWLEARGSSYTEHTPFQPAIQLIEQALELDNVGDPAERFARLKEGLEAVGLDDPDAVAVLAPLLSVDSDRVPSVLMSPELARRRTIDVCAKWVLTLAALQPLTLLIEDLHWCDSGSLELFEQLMVQGSGAALMLIGTSRPGLEAGWQHHPNLLALELEPLGPAETRELLHSLASGPDLPDALLDRVVEETDGIPLFAEEIGRMVLEAGLVTGEGGEPSSAQALDDFAIPATLQDSLMARLDRLNAAKRVAQLAAVIGREFDYGLLEEVSGLGLDLLAQGLRRLVEDDLVFQDGQPPEATYSFKHALIQDAAYRSLLRRSRRPLHRRAAEALERRGNASAEVLARHWEAAERPLEAIEHYARAAEESARHSVHREAIEHLRRALALVDQLPEGSESVALEVDLHTALGASIMALRGYADPEIETAYDRARALCAELEQGSRVGYTLVGLAIYYFNSGQITEGAEIAAGALRIAEREDDDTLELLARVQIAIPSLWQAKFEPALKHAQAASEIYDRERHRDLTFRYGTDQGVAALCMAGWALTCLGRPDQGRARAHAALTLARELGNPFNTVYALAIAAAISWMRGDLDEQQSLAEEVVAISEEQGFEDFRAFGKVLRGGARAVADGDPSGLEECLEALTLAANTGRKGGVGGFFDGIAAAHLAQGKVDEASNWVAAGLALGEETGERLWEPRLLRLRGELHLSSPDPDAERAEADFQRGAEIAHESGDKFSELLCVASLARLLRERGEENAPEELVRPVYSALREGHSTSAYVDAGELLDENVSAPTRP